MARLFSEREIRAAAIFLPLAALLLLAAHLARPVATERQAREVERRMESRADSARLAPFDPNTATRDELLALGLSNVEAVALLRYRATGKIFRIPEDVSLCYGISDSLYRRLEPYIRISRRYAITPRTYRPERIAAGTLPAEPFRIDTVSARYLRAIGALTKRQAEAFIRWRDRSGIRDMEELRACYVVSDSVAAALEPYLIFPEPAAGKNPQPLDLNSADSAALRTVAGIGPRTAGAILRYRERLGGFRTAEQLAEVPGVTERNYEKILKQIRCDSFKIRKIDINFATPQQLGSHPYVAPQTLRKLLKKRQLKGGWSTAEEMIEDDILTRDEAARLAPYLSFARDSGTTPEQDTAAIADSKEESPITEHRSQDRPLRRSDPPRGKEEGTANRLRNKRIRTTIKKNTTMIIMPVKEGENIERALKKFKRKYERTGVLKELRRRQYFTKPSIAKREAMMHAVYVEHMYRNEE